MLSVDDHKWGLDICSDKPSASVCTVRLCKKKYAAKQISNSNMVMLILIMFIPTWADSGCYR